MAENADADILLSRIKEHSESVVELLLDWSRGWEKFKDEKEYDDWEADSTHWDHIITAWTLEKSMRSDLRKIDHIRSESQQLKHLIVSLSGGSACDEFHWHIEGYKECDFWGVCCHDMATKGMYKACWFMIRFYYCCSKHLVDGDGIPLGVPREQDPESKAFSSFKEMQKIDSISLSLRRVAARVLRERYLVLPHSIEDTIGHSKKKGKKTSRHRWDGSAAAAAEEFKKRVSRDITLSLREFCVDYVLEGKDQRVTSDRTLYKKLTTFRTNWDPNCNFGGRRNGHT